MFQQNLSAAMQTFYNLFREEVTSDAKEFPCMPFAALSRMFAIFVTSTERRSGAGSFYAHLIHP